MNLKKLPGTGLTVSSVCLGTGSFGDTLNQSESFAQLDRFLGEGGNLLDTANVYGKWCRIPDNYSEQMLGRYFRTHGGRSKVVISTKGAHPPLSAMRQSRMTETEIRADLEESLRALSTDTVDLYWLHRDDESIPVEEILGILENLRQEGKIRCYGASNWKPRRLLEAEAAAKRAGIPGFCAVQDRWSLARTEQSALKDQTTVAAGQELNQFLRDHSSSFSLFSFTSMGFGLFSKMDREGRIPEKLAQEYDAPINAKRLEALRALSRETGCSLPSLVLAWQTNQPFSAIPISAASRPEQLDDLIAAGSIVLTAEQIEALNCGEAW